MFIVVSAKFVFGNDITIVSNSTGGEYQEFVEAINTLFEVLGRLISAELPLYKLYDNETARMYKKAMKVSFSQRYEV